MTRTIVSNSTKNAAINEVLEKLAARLKKHGNVHYIYSHQTYGILSEEFDEYLDEVRRNNYTRQQSELINIAVAAIWGLASLKTLKQ